MMNRHLIGSRRRVTRVRGLSLVELMIAVAIMALIAGLAAPSFSEYIVTQRLRGVHAQLVTDLQFARSEAISKSTFVSVRFQHSTGAAGASCYVIYTRPQPASTDNVNCDCLAPAGTACSAQATASEVRTVTVDNSLRVTIRLDPSLADNKLTFDPRSGGLRVALSDEAILEATGIQIETAASADRSLRAVVKGSGRAQVCTPSTSRLGGLGCTT
jgi:type IV fimbrial biogenesis protein FimT